LSCEELLNVLRSASALNLAILEIKAEFELTAASLVTACLRQHPIVKKSGLCVNYCILVITTTPFMACG